MRNRKPKSRWPIPALAVALASWIGCASTAPDKSATESSAAKAVREEFDPRSIQEDLLLIQPNFPRPGRGEISRIERAAVPELASTGMPAAEVDSAPMPMNTPDQMPELDLQQGEPAPTLAEPSFRTESITEQVYRVQIMALSNETVARERAESLRASLGVPVFVKAQGPLFVVRVGSFATRREASAMKDRVAAMHNDYRDAYVLGVKETRELRIPVFTHSQPPSRLPVEAPAAQPEPEEELVATFGWRVLLSQYLTNEDAIKEQRTIKRRYKRDDVDVTFAAPWYKVEMGHFSIAEEARAQELAESMKSKGYDALKVRSQVLIPKSKR